MQSLSHDVQFSAKVYVVVNAVMGVCFILFSYLYLKNGSMCQFAGFWAILQVHQMVQLCIAGREFARPLLAE